jgi:hypothetical protein
MTFIKDINQTPEHKQKCNCGSWKNHWVKFNTDRLLWPTICAVRNCKEPAYKVAHVKIVDPYDVQWHLIPLCKGHYEDHKNGEYLDIDDNKGSFANNQDITCKQPFLPIP